jgi:23S rRNA (adenine2030-N6)-methyltransferase
MVARSDDRLALCEKHPIECAALRSEFSADTPRPRASVQELDGYIALRAMLPPPERRALVLIDPPYEAQDEFAQVTEALGEGLQRFPSGVFAIWYPITLRARVEEFFGGLRTLKLPPTLVAELAVAGDDSELKMKGCGLVVVNPPWQFDREIAPALTYLAETLAQGPGAASRIDWLVREM